MIAHLRFPAITLEGLAAEIRRELEARRGFYPGRVDKGNMTQAAADRELGIAGAWADDVARMADAWAAGSAPHQAPHDFTWRARRAALRRELGLRRKLYPEWITSGRMLEADAHHRIEALEALLAIYEDGWDWRGSDGKTPLHSPLADREFAALQADVAARRGEAQKELVLCP